MASIKVKTPPFCEPVSLDEAKTHCRVTISDDDALLASLIAAARVACEEFCGRRFINTEIILHLDAFSAAASSRRYLSAALPWMACGCDYSQMIRLLYSPLVSVSKIRYAGTDDLYHDLLPCPDNSEASPAGAIDLTEDFILDRQAEPPRIFPTPGTSWPATAYVPQAVAIHHIVGCNDEATIAAAVAVYAGGSPVPSQAAIDAYEATLRQADVPATIKTAILLMVANWYENREASTPLDLKKVPSGIEMLLWQERVLDFTPIEG